MPSFWKDYRELWADVENANAYFVAVVLAMMASAQCLVSTQTWLYGTKRLVAREKADTAIYAIEN